MVGECALFTRVTVRNRNDPEKVIDGYIVWRTEHTFGLDIEKNGCYKTATLTYNDWDITYYY